MNVFTTWITDLRSEGRRTLQIPELAITFGGPGPATVSIPDEWTIRLQWDNTPAVGRMQGHLYISRIGYEANRRAIWKAYAKAGRWRDGSTTVFQAVRAFHRYALELYARVQQKAARGERIARAMSQAPGDYYDRKADEYALLPL